MSASSTVSTACGASCFMPAASTFGSSLSSAQALRCPAEALSPLARTALIFSSPAPATTLLLPALNNAAESAAACSGLMPAAFAAAPWSCTTAPISADSALSDTWVPSTFVASARSKACARSRCIDSRQPPMISPAFLTSILNAVARIAASRANCCRSARRPTGSILPDASLRSLPIPERAAAYSTFARSTALAPLAATTGSDAMARLASRNALRSCRANINS
ncbi:hypothetical protein PFLmoz3_03401 [Pseudomonas fluorescens]|uniref:Uncharacterized protein n=1 Tax=Pseudomonas fluorescens TaxID=294 RepID=A0A120G799_PSEFL|nr:hypothetical protein PFLmoz3_03401 [Pseudomonas fluorescens]